MDQGDSHHGRCRPRREPALQPLVGVTAACSRCSRLTACISVSSTMARATSSRCCPTTWTIRIRLSISHPSSEDDVPVLSGMCAETPISTGGASSTICEACLLHRAHRHSRSHRGPASGRPPASVPRSWTTTLTTTMTRASEVRCTATFRRFFTNPTCFPPATNRHCPTAQRRQRVRV